MQSPWRLVRRLTLFLLLAALVLPTGLAAADFDFGLPLFGFEEVRLEKAKPADFNLQLLKKFLRENPDKCFSHFHGLGKWLALILLSDSERQPQLRKIALDHFKVASFSATDPQPGLDYLFLSGLLLANDGEPDPKNVKDHAFEELLLQAEDAFQKIPEYWLLKGILFPRLASRPNGFFSPMRPLEDLKRATGLAPDHPWYFFVLGQAFRQLGSQEASLFLAVASYEKAGTLAPSNYKLHNTLLGIYMGLHEGYQSTGRTEPFWLEEAVYKKILALSPGNPHALNNLGFLYAEFGVHREDAQALCQRAVDAIPDNPGFRDSLGWAAFKNGKYAKAEAELKKAIELNPEVFEPYYHLGTVYYVSKQIDKAIGMYEKAVVLKPNSQEALNNFAYLLAENNRDLDKAKKMAEAAVKLEPNNASYLDTLGWVEFGRNDLDEALRHLEKANQLTPGVGEILFHLGKVHLEKKDFDAGVGFLKEACKNSSGLPDLQKDLFLAIALRAQYQAISEYHTTFGSEARIPHLTRLLMQIARIFQEESQFSDAIAITQMCEKLKRNEISLAKPLFDFYSLATATEKVVGAPAEEPGEGGPAVLDGGLPESAGLEPPSEDSGEEGAPGSDDQDEGQESPAAGMPAPGGSRPVPGTKNAPEPPPQVATCAMALQIGPGFFSRLAPRFLAFSGFETLSLTFYLRDLLAPFRSGMVHLHLPALGQRDGLRVASAWLQFFGCSLEKAAVRIAGLPGLHTRFGRFFIWLVQRGDDLVAGIGNPPAALDFELLAKGFPYRPEGVIAFHLDWPRCIAACPAMFQGLIGNPLHPFSAIHSTYRVEQGKLLETALMVPVEKVDARFMKSLAESLFIYKVTLLRLGLGVELQVLATGECVQVNAVYPKMKQWLEAGWERLKYPLMLVRPQVNASGCFLRRFFFGRTPAAFGAICPSGGKVTINPSLGSLDCDRHPGLPAFPMLSGKVERCAYSRARLEAIFARLAPKFIQMVGKEGLIKRLLSDYNVLPCPENGMFTIDDKGTAGCSVHTGTGKPPTEQTTPKKGE